MGPDLIDLFREHSRAIQRTLGPVSSAELAFLQGPIGLAGEAGELLELFKKEVYYGRPFDRDRVVEELGDVLYYLHATARSEGISMEEIVQANITKVLARHPNGFEDKEG